jgi:hypothetical protein
MLTWLPADEVFWEDLGGCLRFLFEKRSICVVGGEGRSIARTHNAKSNLTARTLKPQLLLGPPHLDARTRNSRGPTDSKKSVVRTHRWDVQLINTNVYTVDGKLV